MDTKIYDEIRKEVDIVDVIGNYVALSRVGKNLKGLCPFHSDNHPSMIVSPEKQIFTCFSCGATGNVFTFVRDYEKCSFNEAVRKVCQISGIKVPSQLNEVVAVKHENKFQRIYDLVKDINAFYLYQLQSNLNSDAAKYVKSRALSDEDVNYFNIGYCPDSGLESINFLKNKGYTDDEIITSGVGVDVGKNNIVDRLRGRVIFAIKDSEGRVVAFSGRRIKDGVGEKYVNTPESVLFHKSNVLYNYSNAIVNSKKDGYCYIVEGFMDAIALHKAGIRNVVATMGTAFTDDHIRLLNNLRCNIRLLFDADNPGQIATDKCIESLIGTKINVSVVLPLAQAKDIDEVLQHDGKEAVVSLINNLQSIYDWKINYIARKTNFANHEEVKGFIKDSVEFLARAKVDDIDLEIYSEKISNLAKVTPGLIKTQFNKAKSNVIQDDFTEEFNELYDARKLVKKLDKYQQADHQILQMMIDSQMNILEYKALRISLSNKTCRQLANMILDKYSRNEDISYPSLLNEATPEIAKLLGELNREKYPEIKMEELAKVVGEDFLDKLDKEDLMRQLSNETDPIRQAEIAQKIINITKKQTKSN